MLNIEWKRKAGLYTNGINGYLGKINIGSVNWDSLTSDKNMCYKVTCTLPQIKQGPNYATQEEGKTALIKLINIWLANALGVEFLPGAPTNES